MRTRLVVSFVLVVLISVGSFVLLLRQSAEREVGAFMFRGGMVGTESLVKALESYYSTYGSWAGVEEALLPTMMGRGRHGMGMGMINQRLRLANQAGAVILDTDGKSQGNLSRADLARAVELKSRGATVGYLLPETSTAFTTSDQANLVERLTRAAVVAGLVGGGLSLLLALLLAYQLTRPIEDLKRSAQKVASGDLGERVRLAGTDELASLGTAFNQMAESLEKAEQNRQAMTADIAHELRTPLAVQRAHLEALEDGVYPLNIENLLPILEQNLMLTRLVDDLRTLALAEAGQLSLDLVEVDLVALAGKMIVRFKPQADAGQVNLKIVQPPGEMPAAWGDPVRIGQIVSNLVTNALRHTPSGGEVVIALDSSPGKVHLSVYDSGPGIPEQALERIFDRFYRADPSRSREAGGTGLGLSIARQLAQAQGGSLSAANHPKDGKHLGGGAVFHLTLPSRNAAISHENQQRHTSLREPQDTL